MLINNAAILIFFASLKPQFKDTTMHLTPTHEKMGIANK